MGRLRVTKRAVDSMKPGDTLWDSEVRGFGVRCQARRTIYQVKASINGRQRWLTIGEHGAPWTVETARQEAQRVWGDIRSGAGLLVVREARRTQPTMAELCTRYMEQHAKHHKKPSSAGNDQRNIDLHVLPLLRSRTVMEITRDDIDLFKRKVREGVTRKAAVAPRDGGKGGRPARGGPCAANWSLSLLSKMFNLAEDWGWRAEGSNPCRRIVRYPERPCERYLTNDEITRLGEVLSQRQKTGDDLPGIFHAIRLLLLTGARVGEVLSMQWPMVDLQRSIVHLPDSKTGRKPLYLSPAAIAVIESIERDLDNPYVIAGAKPCRPLIDLQYAWRNIRKAAGLPDVRLHDLRHTFASLAAAQGASLLMIGKLLGHTTPQTTQRYAHLMADPMKELNQLIGAQLGRALYARTS